VDTDESDLSADSSPRTSTLEDGEGVYGNKERISVKNIREGTREFYEVVREISRQ